MTEYPKALYRERGPGGGGGGKRMVWVENLHSRYFWGQKICLPVIIF